MPEPTLDGIWDAHEFGLARNLNANRRGGKHKYGWKPTPEQERDFNANSAAAEYVAGCLLNRRWLSTGFVPDKRTEGDLEGKIQVRWTERRGGRLPVHPDPEDPADHHYLLVVGRTPDQRLIGWMRGKEAQREEFWDTEIRWPCFMVPQARLWPWEELIQDAVP